MSEAKHTAFTPGPWFQSHRVIPGDKDGMYATQVYDGAGVEIATVAWYPVRGTRCVSTNREANARLIAAAPELFGIVSEMLQSDKDQTWNSDREWFVAKARAALAKAGGCS